MSAAVTPLWWVFVAALLAVFIILVAFGTALVVNQRRFLALHRDYAGQLLAAQDEERAWVAREVHDDALQRIALLDHECDRLLAATPGLDEGSVDSVGAIRTEIKDLGVVLRGLAHRLHPALLERGGLCAALSSLAGEIERTYDLQVAVAVPAGVPRVTPAQALAMYRIAQEGLRNVAKHAGVPKASLELVEVHDGYALTIADRGHGFDAHPAGKNRGLGLVSMQERAFLAQGHCTVTSHPEGGTTVRVRFPRLPESP